MIDAGAYEYGELVATHELSSSNTIIYPNPTTGLLNIDVEANSIKSITIYNAQGQQLWAKPALNKINLSNLSNGTYFLNIETEQGEIIVKSIVKE